MNKNGKKKSKIQYLYVYLNFQMAKEAANRWTDNLFSMKSWCKNKFGLDESTINKHFSIPEELDFVE